MIRFVRLTLLLIAIVLVQTTILPYLRVAGVVADLGLVATVAVAYREGPETGAIFGFAAGLSMDLFLQTPLGLSALAYALTGYFIGILQGALLRSAWWVAPVLGGLGGILGGLLFIGIGALVGQEQLFALRSLRVVLLAGVYDALVAPVMFPIVNFAVRGSNPRTASEVGGPGW
ncbi:MAG: rod shape-determining protein MreD [Acidimicrobiia bacterium]